MFLVGLVDDIVHLKPGLKLMGELLAVSVVIFFDISYQTPVFPWAGLLLSYLWFIGIINAVNLLDNMDGVSSGIVIIGSLGVLLIGVFGYTDHLPVSVFIGGLLVAASFGFWLHNKPPAKIFMGDSGSLVIGFVFAAITIPSEINAFYIERIDFSPWDKVTELLIAIILAAIPILDTTLVTVTRLMRGQSPSVGGKDHSTHRLAHSGLSNWQTLLILYSVSVGCALSALMIGLFPQIGFSVSGIIFLTMLISAFYLASVRIQVAPIKKEGWQQLATSIAYRLPLIKMVMDVVIVSTSLHVAYLVRFDLNPNHRMIESMLQSLPLVVLACLLSNFVLRIYDFSWKNAKRGDVVAYLGAAFLGTLVSFGFGSIAQYFGFSYSRGALVLFFIFYFFALCITRFSYQLLDDSFLRIRLKQDVDGKIPLLLVGSSANVEAFTKCVAQTDDRWNKYNPIGVVDLSNTTKTGKVAGLALKNASAWINEQFSSQPEVLVVDEIDYHAVKVFADELGPNTRVRKIVTQVVEL